MFCPKCGKEIKDTNKFCPLCGVNILETVSTLQGESGKNTSVLKMMKNTKYILLVVFVMVASICLTVMLKSEFSKDGGDDYADVSSSDAVDEKPVLDQLGQSITIPTSAEDFLIQSALFDMSSTATRNSAEILDEFSKNDKAEIEYFLNNGKCWYGLEGRSVITFSDNGTYDESYRWLGGTYSLRPGEVGFIKFDKSDKSYKRVVSAGTITLSNDFIGEKIRYQYVIFKREENKDLLRMVLVDSVAQQVRFVYDSNSEGENYDSSDLPYFTYFISYEYDTNNPKGIDNSLFMTSVNVITLLDRFIQGSATASETAESIKSLRTGLNIANYNDLEKSVYYDIVWLDDYFYCYQQDPTKSINSTHGYNAWNSILITRAELLNDSGMQYFENVDPIFDTAIERTFFNK